MLSLGFLTVVLSVSADFVLSACASLLFLFLFLRNSGAFEFSRTLVSGLFWPELSIVCKMAYYLLLNFFVNMSLLVIEEER